IAVTSVDELWPLHGTSPPHQKTYSLGIINPEELRQYSVTQAITVNGRKIPAGVTRYEVR
ncbi:hypothetical protein THAOC_12720, partial [Thalassiosira oceanica]